LTHRFATGTPEPTTQQGRYREERRATERVSERDLRSFDTVFDRHWETADKLYRIIHPQQEHDERARRPVGGAHATETGRHTPVRNTGNKYGLGARCSGQRLPWITVSL
jgi:hypothetical protein